MEPATASVLGKHLHRLDIYTSLPSTNVRIHESILEGAQPGLVVWAHNQTAGQGRRGNRWYADAGCLTFSLALNPVESVSPALVALVAGLQLVKVLHGYSPALRVKWPNDLWIGNKKVGGISGQCFSFQGRMWLILGIGINVNECPWPDAGYLAEVQGHCLELTRLLHVCLAALDPIVDLAAEAEQNWDLQAELTRYGNFLHRQVVVLEEGREPVVGVAKSVGLDGHLVIHTAKGLQTVYSGTVSLRPWLGEQSIDEVDRGQESG